MDIDRFYRRIGIEEPGQIDIRAVAFEMNLEVQTRPLSSCEARIIGAGDRGIITVQEGVNPRRQRFSIAHEIGHWVYHRGKALSCRLDDIGDGWDVARYREKVANEFAGRLLLPDYLIKPRVDGLKKLTFGDIGKIADEYRVSRSATARRLVEMNHFPCLLVGYGAKGRRWFVRSRLVPDHWFPNLELDPESDALRCIFGGNELGRPNKIGADAFFDRRGADRFDILEETILVGQREAITLLTLTNWQMLEET